METLTRKPEQSDIELNSESLVPDQADYDTILESYEIDIPQKQSSTEKQQESLLDIEANFAGEELYPGKKEWNSIYVSGHQPGSDDGHDENIAIYRSKNPDKNGNQPGSDDGHDENIAIYRSKNPDKNGNKEGWQVYIWDQDQLQWHWQNILNVEKGEAYQEEGRPGEFLNRNYLVMEDGQTLEIVLINKFGKLEIDSVRYTQYPETDFQEVKSPRRHSDNRGSIPSQLEQIHMKLSPEQIEELEKQRIQNQYGRQSIPDDSRQIGANVLRRML